MANAAPDGLAMAQILRNSAAGFLKIGMPVGGMFAAALSLGPDSSEQKAITALDIRMQKGFNQTALNIKYATTEILLHNVLESFRRDIIGKMILFNEELTYMKSPTKKTEESINDFKNYCKSTTIGPLFLLREIRTRLQFCFFEKNAEKNDFLMVEWKKVIRKVLAENVLHHDFPKYESCTNDIFEIVSMMNEDDSKKALNKIQESSVSYEKTRDACNAIISIINDFSYDSSRDCILERILQATQYKHNPLHQFSALVSSVSLNLLSNGIFCANITYAQDPDKYVWYNRSLLEKFEHISDALIKWIPENLNRSWPNFEKEVVNEIIQLSPLSIIKRKDYSNFNHEIYHNLTYYGNVHYRRQNMISQDFSNFNFFANCTADSCFQIMNKEKKVRVIVTRHLRAEYRRSLSAKEWAIKNYPAIKSTIKAHRHIPYLSGLDAFFFSEHGQHLLAKNIYNTIVIIRDTGNIRCSITNYVIRSFRDNKINGVCVLNPPVFYDFEECVQFKVILFI
uniref:Uncharacterized protein n=1 Tax=Panagrolaimus sp. ES5 TaxID=591445 RepID=A0AC34FEQ0_9BILA